MTTSAAPAPNVWPSIRYRDAPAAIEFLTGVFGFAVVARYDSAQDPQIVDHAQLHWPEGGGIMLGSARDAPGWPAQSGCAATYVVTDRAAQIYPRVVASGVQILGELADDQYSQSGQGFSCDDPEGNLWSFGTYRGEPA